MSIISYPSEPAPHESDLVVEPERPGIFAFIMSAMHSSRRHQASRILRQYEPLLAPSEQRVPYELNENSEVTECS